MRCPEARDALWPPERPRLLEPDVERARAHVGRCPECTLYFAQDRRLLEACHGLRSLRAPTEVRLRVLDAIAAAGLRRGAEAPPVCGERGSTSDAGRRAPTERTRVRLTTRAAVVLAITGIGLAALRLGLTERGGPNGIPTHPEDAFVEDYLRRAVGQDFLESSNREEIARFLERELGLRSRLLDTPGLIPTRVEICLLEGRRGAMIVYHLEDRTVTHYLVPDESAPRMPSVANDHGDLAVVTWSSGTVEEALVGELPASELLAMAQTDAFE